MKTRVKTAERIRAAVVCLENIGFPGEKGRLQRCNKKHVVSLIEQVRPKVDTLVTEQTEKNAPRRNHRLADVSHDLGRKSFIKQCNELPSYMQV